MQDIDGFETIIVLNGEKEPYYSNITEWIKILNLSQCQLIYTDKKGVSNARNIALDAVNGKYIVFLDDDDKISPNYLSGLYGNLIEGNMVILSNSLSFTENVPLLKEDYLSRIFAKLQKKKTITLLSSKSFFSVVWAKLIPISVIQNRRFNPNFANGEDALFMASISDAIKSIQLTREDIIYCRRIRENSASQQKRKIKKKIKNSLMLLWCYLKIYLTSPMKYNFFFFLNRYMAVFKVLFVKEF
jgi:glycosyltransferase involved in cell wall biosynthesis